MTETIYDVPGHGFYVKGPPCPHCGSENTTEHLDAEALNLPTWCLACARPSRRARAFLDGEAG